METEVSCGVLVTKDVVTVGFPTKFQIKTASWRGSWHGRTDSSASKHVMLVYQRVGVSDSWTGVLLKTLVSCLVCILSIFKCVSKRNFGWHHFPTKIWSAVLSKTLISCRIQGYCLGWYWRSNFWRSNKLIRIHPDIAHPRQSPVRQLWKEPLYGLVCSSKGVVKEAWIETLVENQVENDIVNIR